MHVLQPKHSKLKPQEADAILAKFNISRSQLPKIKKEDPALPDGVDVGDVIKIERREEKGKDSYYFRIVVP